MNENTSPPPITIRVGYEWTDRKQEPKAAPPQERYKFIKDATEVVIAEVVKRGASRKGKYALYIQVGRMRAMHGSELLPRFRDLCKNTDIVAFDITGENPNVMLELGMALAAKAETPGRVYIFKQKTIDESPIPGDLPGYFITYFHTEQGKNKHCELKLKDQPGFRAALRTAVIAIARERGMWGESGWIDEDSDK